MAALRSRYGCDDRGGGYRWSQPGPDRAPRSIKTACSRPELDAILGGRSYYLSKGWELSSITPSDWAAGVSTRVTGLTHPHDLLLELSSEQGLLAVGIFVALAFASWRASMTSYRRSKSLEAIVSGGFIILLLAQASLSLGINDNRFLWFSFGLALALPRIALDR